MSGDRHPIVVVHDLGDEDAGAPWRAAFDDAGWTGPVLAPDLPGHGREAPPPDGSYELVDPAWFLLRKVHGVSWAELPVLVGVGAAGWAAQLFALAGRAAALVLVDGLGGPWQAPAAWAATQRIWLRALADDPAAVALAPSGGLDPRLRHGVLPLTGRRMAERSARALTVPVLIVQTPRAALEAVCVDDLVRQFGGSATVEQLADRGPDLVATAVTEWARRELADIAS